MATKWYPAVANAIQVLQKGASEGEVEFLA